MDAVPIRLGMEFDAWGTRVQQSEEVMKQSLDQLSLLPVGGTAVGSEINAPQGFAEKTVQYISELSGHPFNVASNKAVAISSHDALLAASSVLSNLAANLISITSTMRWLSSGPRTGLAELMLPGAEPGSSIMPGKVNPSVLEGVQMSYYVVLGNHQVLTLANTHSSELDLNTAKPVMIERFLESTVLLHDACDLLNKKCVRGIKANLDVIKKHLSNTLMTVTALTPAIGYDKATAIAVKALNEGTTLKESAIALGVAEDLYDTVVVPSKMVAPFTSGIKKVA